MISFSLTNEQKRSIFEATLRNLEMEIFQLILVVGGDPDSYDYTQIAEMADIPLPSAQGQLYASYNRYLDIKQKIDSL